MFGKCYTQWDPSSGESPSASHTRLILIWFGSRILTRYSGIQETLHLPLFVCFPVDDAQWTQLLILYTSSWMICHAPAILAQYHPNLRKARKKGQQPEGKDSIGEVLCRGSPHPLGLLHDRRADHRTSRGLHSLPSAFRICAFCTVFVRELNNPRRPGRGGSRAKFYLQRPTFSNLRPRQGLCP